MVTRQEAQEAVARYLGESDVPKLLFVDNQDGRWLVVHHSGHLGVDRDGQVKPAGQVFSPDEYRRLQGAVFF